MSAVWLVVLVSMQVLNQISDNISCTLTFVCVYVQCTHVESECGMCAHIIILYPFQHVHEEQQLFLKRNAELTNMVQNIITIVMIKGYFSIEVQLCLLCPRHNQTLIQT